MLFSLVKYCIPFAIKFRYSFRFEEIIAPPLQGWLIKLEDVPDQRFTIG